MADPDDLRPLDPPTSSRLAADTPRSDGRDKGFIPLFWLLVLAALLAFGWTLYNRHASEVPPALPANPAPASAPAPKPA